MILIYCVFHNSLTCVCISLGGWHCHSKLHLRMLWLLHWADLGGRGVCLSPCNSSGSCHPNNSHSKGQIEGPKRHQGNGHNNIHHFHSVAGSGCGHLCSRVHADYYRGFVWIWNYVCNCSLPCFCLCAQGEFTWSMCLWAYSDKKNVILIELAKNPLYWWFFWPTFGGL